MKRICHFVFMHRQSSCYIGVTQNAFVVQLHFHVIANPETNEAQVRFKRSIFYNYRLRLDFIYFVERNRCLSFSNRFIFIHKGEKTKIKKNNCFLIHFHFRII